MTTISKHIEESILASRVDYDREISGLSKSKLEALIEVEEEAQRRLSAANDYRAGADDEERLPKKYDALVDAADELRELRLLNAAVDLEDLNIRIKDLIAEIDDLEKVLPVEPEVAHISGECFSMGGRVGDIDTAVNERQHEVCLDDYEIGIYEVTFHEFDRYSTLKNLKLINDMGWGRGYRPVINVSYSEIEEYVSWLSYQTNKKYRLPTEAEWEYAARGGNDSIYPWGNRVGRARANCLNCGSDWDGIQTAPVGSFEPNGLGIYDMAGNVAERMCSIYRAEYDGSESVCHPLDAAGGRAVRGGGWKSHSRNIRASFRYALDGIDTKSRFQGFRLVRDLN